MRVVKNLQFININNRKNLFGSAFKEIKLEIIRYIFVMSLFGVHEIKGVVEWKYFLRITFKLQFTFLKVNFAQDKLL